MILTCPQCSTRYQADAAKFQPAGRNVRCAKCSHVWHQDAPAPEPDPVSEIPIVAEASPPPIQAPARAAYAPRQADSRERVTMVAPPAVQPKWPMNLAIMAGWAGLIAIVLFVGWAALSFRQQVAMLWPQSASLYAALGLNANASGIDIRDVRYSRSMENGQRVLALSGYLANLTSRELPLPQLRVTLFDEERHELYHWTFAATATTLHPGQGTTFKTRLSNPPSGTRSFELRLAKAGE
jgi:predicted Zn finger-like uncharacterized protein